MTDATNQESMSRIDAERADDQRTDVKAILVVFVTAIAMVVHFISGWTF